MESLTNSERSCFKKCEHKWYYQYILNRVPVQVSEPLWLGSALGLGFDAIWEGKEDFITPFADYIELHGYKDKEKLLVPYYKGKAALIAYKEFYENDMKNWEVIAVEHSISYDVGGVTLLGKLDKVLRNRLDKKLYVLDHKSTKDPIDDPSSDYWLIKILDPQLVGYKVALEKEFNEPVIMLYDVIKKHGSKGPKLRAGVRKKKAETDEEWEERKAEETETWDEYYDRVLTDYRENTGEYFKRRTIYRSKEELEEWRDEFITDATNIHAAKLRDIHPKDHGSCGKRDYKCEYFNVCTKVDSIESDNFVTKKHRHPELDGEEIEGIKDVVI